MDRKRNDTKNDKQSKLKAEQAVTVNTIRNKMNKSFHVCVIAKSSPNKKSHTMALSTNDVLSMTASSTENSGLILRSSLSQQLTCFSEDVVEIPKNVRVTLEIEKLNSITFEDAKKLWCITLPGYLHSIHDLSKLIYKYLFFSDTIFVWTQYMNACLSGNLSQLWTMHLMHEYVYDKLSTDTQISKLFDETGVFTLKKPMPARDTKSSMLVPSQARINHKNRDDATGESNNNRKSIEASVEPKSNNNQKLSTDKHQSTTDNVDKPQLNKTTESTNANRKHVKEPLNKKSRSQDNVDKPQPNKNLISKPQPQPQSSDAVPPSRLRLMVLGLQSITSKTEEVANTLTKTQEVNKPLLSAAGIEMVPDEPIDDYIRDTSLIPYASMGVAIVMRLGYYEACDYLKQFTDSKDHISRSNMIPPLEYAKRMSNFRRLEHYIENDDPSVLLFQSFARSELYKPTAETQDGEPIWNYILDCNPVCLVYHLLQDEAFVICHYKELMSFISEPMEHPMLVVIAALISSALSETRPLLRFRRCSYKYENQFRMGPAGPRTRRIKTILIQCTNPCEQNSMFCAQCTKKRQSENKIDPDQKKEKHLCSYLHYSYKAIPRNVTASEALAREAEGLSILRCKRTSTIPGGVCEHHQKKIADYTYCLNKRFTIQDNKTNLQLCGLQRRTNCNLCDRCITDGVNKSTESVNKSTEGTEGVNKSNGCANKSNESVNNSDDADKSDKSGDNDNNNDD